MARKAKAQEDEQKKERKQNGNLVDVNVFNSRRTQEERSAIASKAGKASGEKRRANRMMMDIARRILEMPVSDSYTANKDIMRRFGIEEKDMNYAVAMLATMAVKGISGDINAAKFVRDSAGLDAMTVLKEEQFEYMKENGQNINVSLDGELTTKSRVQIYLPEIEKMEE